ncbi:MAG: 3-deoxy-8-phosphooctulonate synthase [Blastocatellia bacterium]|nr:3-deoxy-8-phosphooctulonate synthase [Blastocatellia bacterium]MCS7158578.1 3-deoxy-8-phosphooctulonate synthase [Blastocatellia bacterium]MDW8169296.1 3-deoxy-8-phosphooctulonate synthase [Acidobacteriota bacterium]MDW8257774.1 3-deoxy-8-phosphooctulonate synthase [Acidobacteriota bacterium]
MNRKSFRIGDRVIGGPDLLVIAGPCVIESEEHALWMAERLAEIAGRLGLPYIFKASYDKANRSSIHSFRGPGLEAGLKILARIRREVGVPILTDVHETVQVGPVSEVVDVLQIPAFLSRQTDLIVAAARSGRAVNIKKGQFLAPWDMRYVIEKATTVGCERILVTERGTTFGYNNLVVDMRSLPILRTFGYPVILDVTHSVQLPGGAGGRSSGQSEFIEPLARAGVACGVDGIFMEVHDQPERALSDGPNSLPLERVAPLLTVLKEIHQLVRSVEGARGDEATVA